MKANKAKALGLLLLGFVSILLLASFALEDPRMNKLTKGPHPSASSPLFYLHPGIFHPLTEEYLRQKARELPYMLSESELFSEPRKNAVFEHRSPLELALLPEEEPPLRKKKSRELPMSTPGKEDWRPVTEEEREKWEIEIADKAVEMGTELAESLSMPYFADSILWTTQRFNVYRHYLADQYRLHFKVSQEDASVSYQVKY